MSRKYQRLLFMILILALSSVFVVSASAQAQAVQKHPPGFVIPPKSFTPSPASGQSKAGKQLFQRNNCGSCHSIDGSGGCLAPSLDGIGARRNTTFILARITNSPAAIKRFERLYGPELMVHPRLTAQSAGRIAAYLMTLPEPKGGIRVLPHTRNDQAGINVSQSGQKTADAAKGKVLFYDHGCIACHSIGAVGGHLAPRLDAVSARRTRQFITERISNAKFVIETTTDEYQGRENVMPSANLNEEEVRSITDFLMSLPARP